MGAVAVPLVKVSTQKLYEIVLTIIIYIYIQWGEQAPDTPPTLQALPPTKHVEVCNSHQRAV